MTAFAFAAIASTGIGPTAAGWIEMNPHLEWRWIQWIHLMYVPENQAPHGMRTMSHNLD